MKRLILFIIRLYQKTLSYDHGIRGRIFSNTRYCKFNPTCSEYTYISIERFGIVKGAYMGIKRFLKCNSKTPAGTYSPVPEKE